MTYPDDASQQQAMLIDEEEQMTNHFAELAAIDCTKYVEKKGQLTYLSWAWAVDQLLRRDPDARWEYGEPTHFPDGTMMVHCTVTAFGRPRRMQLPVMDNRNKPIANPDAFAVNTAMQRCLVKAIALHGLGLYIYAGEDVPRTEEGEKPADPAAENALQELRDSAINGTEALRRQWQSLDAKMRQSLQAELASLKKAAAQADADKPVRAVA
jgi:hypothetical protein